MNEPTPGRNPERPAGQPAPQEPQNPLHAQDPQEAQHAQHVEQATERIDTSQPERPTEPIDTSRAPAFSPEPGTDTDADPDAGTPADGWPEDPAATGYQASGHEPYGPGAIWDAPESTTPPLPEPAEPRGVPLGTLVFGLVVVALGLLILVSVLYDITLSGSAVAIALFLGAGLVLIIGGLVAARRSSGTSRSGA